MDKYVCVHGHFYQPPRENPWLEEIEIQDSAYPYHDWNERVAAECYAPNAASRLLDGEGGILDIVSNYAQMSFDFGPTVLSWMEKKDPELLRSIVEADRVSQRRFSGHGSALAQAYNHMIMPLANRRDQRTQVIWGKEDFRKRFGRDPEGMWLPETAANTETLELLAEQGIQFAILAPRQARAIRPLGSAEWQSVEGGKIDPTRAYLCRLPSGKSISLFFYDGPISHGIAFEGLLASGEGFAKRLAGAFTEDRSWPQLVHIATDGETYGHHHRFGDMALAYGLHYLGSSGPVRITNYGEYLDRCPPDMEVQIYDDSSWSCIHGVERWRADCGCSSGMHAGWHQRWREPLREALDRLRDQLIPAYEGEAVKYLRDPWAARDEYISVILDRSPHQVEEVYLRRHRRRPLSPAETVTVLKLLELQRHAMLMYTSCGWFFDEISGLETVQVMAYAAKAIQLAGEVLGLSLEEPFVADLKKAESNLLPNGAEVYRRHVLPFRTDLTRVAAHYAISSLFHDYPQEMEIYNYQIKSQIYEKRKAGRLTLATGRAVIRSGYTWEETAKTFAVLHLGDHNVNGGIRDFNDEEAFSAMQTEVETAFERGETAEIIRLMDKHFGMNSYSLADLFRDEQRRVIEQILELTEVGIRAAYRQIYEQSSPVLNFLSSLRLPLPKPILVAVEYIINSDLKRLFGQETVDQETLQRLNQEIQRWSVPLDRALLGHMVSLWITSRLEEISREPKALFRYQRIDQVLRELAPLSLPLQLWKAQNTFFLLKKEWYEGMKEGAEKGEPAAQKWMEAFQTLAEDLGIKI